MVNIMNIKNLLLIFVKCIDAGQFQVCLRLHKVNIFNKLYVGNVIFVGQIYKISSFMLYKVLRINILY